MIARRRRKSARQCAGSCAKGSHSAAQGRDASRRNESNKAARAPETWQSPSHWYFILSGTETCSQNGDHCLRSRTQRERAPTTKVCAAIRGVVRKGFTLSRTRPRRTVPRRLVRALLCSARHSAMRRGLVWLSVSRWRAATRVVIRAKRLTHSVRGVWHSSIPTPKLLPKRHPVFWRRG